MKINMKNIDKYSKYLKKYDISEEQKKKLLESLYEISNISFSNYIK